jgi:GNAT superfamily N-acetyltransferase
VGPDLVGPGLSHQLTNDDWFGLRELIFRDHEELNRTREEADMLFEWLIGDSYTEVWVLRDADGDVGGFAALHLGQKMSDRHTASLRIHLSEELRGKNLGARLISGPLKWAEENGITRITATPYLDGSDKLGFFLRHGFKPEGIAIGAAKVGEKLVDVSLLARVA